MRAKDSGRNERGSFLDSCSLFTNPPLESQNVEESPRVYCWVKIQIMESGSYLCIPESACHS